MRSFTNQSQFNRIMVHLFKSLKAVKGQSLAEFAVVTAMMATFITTALPKFSDLMETGKAQKSIQELDKLLIQAKSFYETTAALEGRGRLPGQDKFDMKSSAAASLQALFISSSVASDFANLILFSTLSSKRIVSWLTIAILFLKDFKETLFVFWPSTDISPL